MQEQWSALLSGDRKVTGYKLSDSCQHLKALTESQIQRWPLSIQYSSYCKYLITKQLITKIIILSSIEVLAKI